MTALPTPSATGVRIAGDTYQWQLAWQGCVTALRDASAHAPNPVVAVGVEVDGTGNLDDVVLYRVTPPHTYAQVKYTVDSSSPVNTEYLLKSSDSGGPSILNKIAKTWRSLSADGTPVDLAIITNRFPDPSDPLISARDSRTQLLMPKAGQGGSRSEKGRARQQWAVNAELSEAELCDLLGVLRFDLARDVSHLHDHLQLLMLAAGLRTDDPAIHAGADWVAREVRDGQRKLTLTAIREAIESLQLSAGPVRSVVSIATLKPDPAATEADYAIDWVDRFDGASAYSKRRPLAPATWFQLQEEIEAAPSRLPPGATAVAVTGSLRLAPAFLTGTAFRMVTGADIAVLQRGQLWSSAAPYDTGLVPVQEDYEIGQGSDLAVAIAVATDPTEDVLRFLRQQGVPVSRLLVFRPPTGAKDNAVPNAATANALAVGIRDALRRTSRGAARIHLFQAGPMGLALLLGHRWNRLRPTVVYEDVATEWVYEEAFTIDA
ncbi:SAVED domain-containing protein [Microbispora hainanensis]|uniref:SAVED domain-containing protein n=1 Tax=Microbispora hainanensis TaxID=568844 RepID=A0A544YVJ0_9ACTN|nr:SAVED domain-containing protein [Microbispora hainanensis]TQS20785.1 SAVED domain-containing protein [Microbispora hainanensis]